MGISSPSLKRRSSNDYNDQSSKRPSRAAHPGYPPPVPIQPSYPYPPPPAAHPHASMMHYQAPSDYRQRRQPDKPDPPKKRGRPSRADKAKRDLQPILPRPLAPQLAPQVAHPTHFSPPSHIVDVPPSFNGLAPLAPKRTTLPPMLPSPVRPAGPITPPEAYVTSKGSPRPMNPSSPRSLHPSALSPRSERPRPPSSHENGRPSSSRGGSPPHKRLLVD